MSERLALILQEKKSLILRDWEHAVRSALPAARIETPSALRDSVPVFLDELSEALKTSLQAIKPQIIEFAHKHGSERANLSEYSIEDALSEYNILRRIIFKHLEESAQVSPTERDLIYEAINFGMMKAGTEYAKLQMQNLNHEKAELKVLFELAGTGKAVINPKNMQIIRVNQTFCEMIGYSEAELLSMKVNDITYPEDRSLSTARDEKWSIQRRYVRKNGDVFWGEVYLSALPPTPEHSHLTICTIVDISERKIIENQAIELSHRLKRITDIQPSLIAQVDHHLRYQFVNQTYEKWFGLSVNEVIGKSVLEIVGEEAFGVLRPHFEMALKGKKDVFETEITYLNGETKYIHGTFSPGFTESGEVNQVYISINDISEQRKILEAFEKEQTLRDKFISALSHDLRTPLTTASISAQMIQRKSMEPNLTNLAGKITASLKRVDKMIEDLLDANSLRAGKKIVPELMEMNIVDLVKSTLNELETIYGDRFILDSQEEIITHLSPNGIRRVIENLCSNAIKYGSATAPVSVYLTKEKYFLNIGVHNFGTSLKETNTAQLFEEFVRSSSAERSGKKGWGIGLSIVKGVIEAHGGMVDIESDDHGTLFKIKLPLDARAFVYSIKENQAHA